MVTQSRTSPGHLALVLSDTPLSSTFLSGLLQERGVIEGDMAVLVSNEMGQSKERGGAYAHVRRRTGVRVGRWTHTGDNEFADGVCARRAAVRSRIVTGAQLNRYERLLEGALWDTGGASSLVAGVSRLTRLRMVARGMAPARAAVACGVLFPVALAYVLWCFQQARRRGLRRLEFAARDGQLLYEIARKIGPYVAPEVAVGYFHGSRLAWLAPAAAGAAQPDFRLLADHARPSTLRGALDRLGVTAEQADVLLGGSDPALDDPLSPSVIAQALERLFLTPHGREVLAGHANAAIKGFGAYCKARSLAGRERWAIVDMASRGNVGRLLNAAVANIGLTAPVELYFGLHGSASTADREIAGWLFDDAAGVGEPERMAEINVLLEMLFAADHGSVTGYDEHGQPQLADDENGSVLKWGLREVRSAVELCVDELSPLLVDLNVDASFSTVALALLEEFWLRPTAEEVGEWGAFPFEADSGRVYEVAEPVTTAEFCAHLMRGRLHLRARQTWPAGVTARSTSLVKAVRRVEPVVRRLRRKLQRGSSYLAGWRN